MAVSPTALPRLYGVLDPGRARKPAGDRGDELRDAGDLRVLAASIFAHRAPS